MLTFPAYITAMNCAEVLPVLNDLMSSEITSEVSAKQIKFVDPFSLCLLAACCDQLQQQDKQLKVRDLSP